MKFKKNGKKGKFSGTHVFSSVVCRKNFYFQIVSHYGKFECCLNFYFTRSTFAFKTPAVLTQFQNLYSRFYTSNKALYIYIYINIYIYI